MRVAQTDPRRLGLARSLASQLGELRWAALVITLGSELRVRAVRDYLVVV